MILRKHEEEKVFTNPNVVRLPAPAITPPPMTPASDLQPSPALGGASSSTSIVIPESVGTDRGGAGVFGLGTSPRRMVVLALVVADRDNDEADAKGWMAEGAGRSNTSTSCREGVSGVINMTLTGV